MIVLADRMQQIAALLQEKSIDGEDGCILWTGYRQPNGYGWINYRGIRIAAHRAALIASGVDMPDDMDACHRCDVRACINADHLYVGGQIAAELLATRAVLKKLLDEIDLSPIGMPEEVLVEVRKVCEVFAHSVTDSIDVPPPCDTVETPDQMHARIVTETADGIAKERGLTVETFDE